MNLYHPRSEWISLGIRFEDAMIHTQDGESINVWLMPNDTARFVFLLCHGNAGNNSYRQFQMKSLHELGFAVAIFDYRGYGKSTGRPTEDGLYNDAETVYRWLTEEKKYTPDQIILIGTSLGGSVAVDLAMRQPVRALVVESSFTSKFGMAKVVFPFIPIAWLSYEQFNSLEKIGSLKCPVLIAHGDRDRIIPYGQGRLLFESAREPKFFYTITGADHNDYLQIGGKPYLDTIRRFATNLTL
ncbi:alpha/beta hydrolase [bacterium]|nr:alpha/beta hydrolase [bacterium]